MTRKRSALPIGQLSIKRINVRAHRIEVALKTFFNGTYVQFGSFVDTLSKDTEIICNCLDLMDSNTLHRVSSVLLLITNWS